jgi:hypothetical protein
VKKFALIAVFIAIAAISYVVPAHALDFTVTCTTNAVTDANISADQSGNIAIDSIVITNQGSTAQTVTIYEQASSSTTVTARLTVQIGGDGLGNEETLIVNWPYYNTMKVTDFAVRKSTTGSVVTCYVNHR